MNSQGFGAASGARSPLLQFGRYSDLALAGLLVGIVALFVLPLPHALLDLLIATNLALSLVLLIAAIYVPSVLSLSTFPSLLLFTTLFRLGLNIASTKLILLHANAGQIIDTFGRLIVGNNVVVGGVVFTIIAVVQFIVIAKGSERVAEVAARFALDAMPGKQMSIDADVRSGALSSSRAQQRRALLEQECQLHGAMDGAMKFVKGDAIAGIVIALVNIGAGIAIGTLMHSMSVGDALQRYAILTVGDGMVSQIPSLLVSVAAGIVITRVTSSDDRQPQLAAQIGHQLFSHPRALAIAAVALASFLLVPGFPKWVFILLCVALGAAAFAARAAGLRGSSPSWISHQDVADAEQTLSAPLAVRLAEGLRDSIDRHVLETGLSATRTQLERELGPVFPRLQLLTSPSVEPDSYEILVHDVVVSVGTLPAPPGVGALPGEAVIARHVEQVVRDHAWRLLGLQEVHRLIAIVQREAPELAAEVARALPPQRLAEVLRRLLQEGIPIRNLQGICESVTLWAAKEPDTIALTELVRIDLGRFITSRHVGSGRKLAAILFEPSLLERVHGAVERSPRGNLLLLSPAVADDVRSQLQALLAQAAGPVVAITSVETRRYLKTLVEPVAPQLAVLSYQEVDDDVQLQPVGWISNPQAA
ncbi:FHIPEP family type III secretion protein [Aquincola sp. S2]|uniref:FHIPEP family type III secretion protein n=1 Tax=Pseudaquabacterium terrae TaxID=2732868 RepID=A0ABX2ELI6_9BURK|nr:flagellar biosynthesis protein FlhA [Aquabacterium terrae]NRF69427.1 FHIPEP family type III secretion protein [Aquabacterium terrae]